MKITDNTQTLKRISDFTRVYRRGKKAAGGYVAVYAQKNRCGFSRLGLTVSKSVGNAVTRSRTKRILRESYRNVSDKLPGGYDYIFVARSAIVGKSLAQVTRDLEYALKKLSLII